MTAFVACSCTLACSLRSDLRLWPRRHTFSIAVPVKQPALRLLTNACSAHHQPMTISGSSAASASRIRPPPCPHKLATRSTACVLLGYPTDHRGYRCFDLATRCVITSRHVTFDESTFPYRDPSFTKNPPSAATIPRPTTDAVVIQELPQPRVPVSSRVPAHTATPSPIFVPAGDVPSASPSPAIVASPAASSPTAAISPAPTVVAAPAPLARAGSSHDHPRPGRDRQTQPMICACHCCIFSSRRERRHISITILCACAPGS